MRVRGGFWVIALVALIALASAKFSQAAIFFRIFYFGLGVIVSSFFWAWLSIKGIGFQRKSRIYQHQVGQVFEERFELSNRFKLLRVWIEVSDLSTLLGAPGSHVSSWLGTGEVRSYVTYSSLERRGSFPLGPTQISSGDPFGLFSNQIIFSPDTSLLVLPSYIKLDVFPLLQGALPGGRALRTKTLEATPFAAGVREYVPGDAMRMIHWPSSVRRDRLMVKEFDQDPQSDLWILLDGQRSANFLTPELKSTARIDRFWIWKHRSQVALPLDTFEYGVSCAASIADFALRAGKSVGLACSGSPASFLPAEKGTRQSKKVLETLAFANSMGITPLLDLVEAQSTHTPRGSTVIVISARSDDQIFLACEVLNRRGLKPVAVVIDFSTFSGNSSDITASSRLLKSKYPYCVITAGKSLKTSLETLFQIQPVVGL